MHILSDAQAAALRTALAEINTILDGASFVSLESAPSRIASAPVQVSDTPQPQSQVKTRASSPKRGRGHRALTEAKVREIKQLLAAGDSSASIARSFGVHVTTVNLIKWGKTWKQVDAAAPRQVVLTA
jgi:hypothetical protein